MVGGLDKFKEYFSDYKDQYVLIGGAACDLIMEEFEGEFRATKDLDLVLIVEALSPEFTNAFWKFINDGKYRNKSVSSDKPHFYRFDKPQELGFPYMLELFSRVSCKLNFPDSNLIPLHIADSVSSLSAILLDDSYYNMLLEGRTEIDGVRLLAPDYIIPFKAKAWIDLRERKLSGYHVDEKQIRKHKNDIIRMLTILDNKNRLSLPDEVARDMREFILQYEKNPVDLKTLKIKGITNQQIIDRLKQIYMHE